MPISATKLRENIYQVLDQAIESGKAVEIERKGVILQLVPPRRKRNLTGIPKDNCVVGDPEELVHVDWSAEWKPFL